MPIGGFCMNSILDIANELSEKYDYKFLDQYLNKLTDQEILNFELWFGTQIDIVYPITNEKYTEIMSTIDSQRRFLNIANWNWKINTPCEDKKIISKCSAMFNQRTIKLISIICICAVFLYIFSVTFFSWYIDEGNRRFVDQSLGNLYGILNTIIGFYCGGAYTMAQATTEIQEDKKSPKLKPTIKDK